MLYKTYILFSAALNRYYVGHTGDELSQRVRRHLSEHKGFTAKAKDWKLVHFELYGTKKEAYAREREIKGWKSRKRILQLCSSSASLI
jgi:putative endonuclease